MIETGICGVVVSIKAIQAITICDKKDRLQDKEAKPRALAWEMVAGMANSTLGCVPRRGRSKLAGLSRKEEPMSGLFTFPVSLKKEALPGKTYSQNKSCTCLLEKKTY
jgi:hypothetical protein